MPDRVIGTYGEKYEPKENEIEIGAPEFGDHPVDVQEKIYHISMVLTGGKLSRPLIEKLAGIIKKTGTVRALTFYISGTQMEDLGFTDDEAQRVRALIKVAQLERFSWRGPIDG